MNWLLDNKKTTLLCLETGARLRRDGTQKIVYSPSHETVSLEETIYENTSQSVGATWRNFVTVLVTREELFL
jgi:hypothetical protein